ncbi:MAG TPA: hypothetical protein PLY87_21310 [Planctomycetaceae bacterium]|nr:hypothetical protein [Planctomycetaceae bacterium]HQZ67648.1 hypothetical protein [Planctomycetaceae bacterium]HRA90542.1 hypothetical protein [Planctomycetaceae bacterium]
MSRRRRTGRESRAGPDLTESIKILKGAELLRQVLEPSSKINEKFQNHTFVTTEGRVITGVIVKETDDEYQVATNLLTPNTLTTIRKSDLEEKLASEISPMPVGLLNTLTKGQILDLHAYLENGDFKLPEHLRKQHLP